MLRLFVLLVIMLLIDWYTFQAFRTVTSAQSAGTKRILNLVFWSLTVISLAFVLLNSTLESTEWNKALVTYFQAAIIIFYFSKFLVLPFLMIDDLVRGVQWIINRTSGGSDFSASRNRFLSQAGILLGSIPFVTLNIGMMGNVYRYRVFSKKLALKSMHSSLSKLRIVQISDIHSGSFTFREPVKRAIELINQQEADLVFFTGDLVNEQAKEMKPFIDIFSQIKAKYGVFSILGNHDYGDYHPWKNDIEKKANFQALLDTHRQLGWTLLRNENRIIDIDGHSVGVIGVENYSAHDRFVSHGDLKKAYNGCSSCSVKLLLSHDPSHWDAEVSTSFKDIDITFSGHTHGMQYGIEIPGWVKWSPIKLFYKQWAGLYQKDNQYLYVNRGLGFLGYPGRVGILPEITTIDIHPA